MSLLQSFASVNTEQDGVQQLTLEAQEARVIRAYENALALIQAQRGEEAKVALQQLLDEPVVAECATDQLHRVKFLSLRNLAELLSQQPQGVDQALRVYCQATEVVADDALLWNKLGTLAAEVGYWAAARTAFERGLELDPHHPTMADKLLQLLLHMGDAEAAAGTAAAMLRLNPHHALAHMAVRQQQRDRPLPALPAGLLQLAPLSPGATGAAELGSQHAAADRPRTLDQPTWQQLLHHSRLFLASNRLMDGGSSAAATVRFKYKRPAQGTAEPGTASGAAAAPATVHPGMQPAEAAASPVGEPAPEAAGGPAPMVGTDHTAGRVPCPTAEQVSQGVAVAATPSTSPAAAQQSPQVLAGTTVAPALAPQGSEVQTPLLSAAEQLNSPGTAAAVEEQEQRHPNGQSSGARTRKVDVRATRSRAASGKAALALPATAASSTLPQGPIEEAWELLTTAGPLLSGPEVPASVSSPLLPAVFSPKPGQADSSTRQEPASAANPPQQHLEEEAAVKAFIKKLPRQGFSRLALTTELLSVLATPDVAAKLSPEARRELLFVANEVQHDMPHLPDEQCLVLGELFVDAAAASKSAELQRPGTALLGSNRDKALVQAGADGRQGVRSSGAARRSGMGGRQAELTTAALQQSARLWLSRYRLSLAERGVYPDRLGSGNLPTRSDLIGLVRLCWATGRLLEVSRDVPAAVAAYTYCQRGMQLLGEQSILLPHCRLDSNISLLAEQAKQHALRLLSILDNATSSAASGDHSKVIAALEPILLCCTDKEQQILQLEQRQWLHGMKMLLSAATAMQSWGLALRCHVWLLSALLPNVPEELTSAIRSPAAQDTAAPSPLPDLMQAAVQQLMQPTAVEALDTAASFLQEHCRMLVEVQQKDSTAGTAVDTISRSLHYPVSWKPSERAICSALQIQLLFAVASCGAALATAGPEAVESKLNLKVNAERMAMCDCATILLQLSSPFILTGQPTPVTPGSRLKSLEQGQEVAWQLCDALGTSQALLERHGRFVQACMSELRWHLKELESLRVQLAPTDSASTDLAMVSGTDDSPDVEELQTGLTAGLQHCLRWLYGLELPGWDKLEEWGGAFEAKGDAILRQLRTRESVADIWPLIVEDLCSDLQHVTKHKGFLQAVLELFPEPPAIVCSSSTTSWRQLSCVEPPKLPASYHLDGSSFNVADPMAQLLRVAARLANPIQSEGGVDEDAACLAQPMSVDATSTGGAEVDRSSAVQNSLYHLIAALQDAEGTGISSWLDAEAGEALERHLQPVKWDLCYNPNRFASWERLAAAYHEAADGLKPDDSRIESQAVDVGMLLGVVLQHEASKAMTHREWTYSRDLQTRFQCWRRMGYWSLAGAWLCAPDDEHRDMLLTATGSRLLQDAERTLPFQDPWGCDAAWNRVQRSSSHHDSCQLALAAYEAAEAIADMQDNPAHWEVLLAKARCMRKLKQPAVNWLPILARACHHATVDEGGVLYAVYALHASRMRVLLELPSAHQWSVGDWQPDSCISGSGRTWPAEEFEEQQRLLHLVASYCFHPTTSQSLLSTKASEDIGAEQADRNLRADWQALLEDCCSAMQWCLDRDRMLHRAAHRLAAALKFTCKPVEAVAVLAPFFTSRAKHVFLPAMIPIQEPKVGGGSSKRSRSTAISKGRRGAESSQGHRHMSECSWGEAPARPATTGLQESDSVFGTRFRKTLRLYLACLVDATKDDSQAVPVAARAPPLEILQAAAAFFTAAQAAASKAWDGCDKLARGELLLALAAALRNQCPLEAMQPQALAAPPSVPPVTDAGHSGSASLAAIEEYAATAMDISNSLNGLAAQQAQHQPAAPPAPGSSADHAPGSVRSWDPSLPTALRGTPAAGAAVQATPGVWKLLPTPATQGRQQHAEQLLQVAAGLEAGKAAPLLAIAYDVFSDYSLHTDGGDKWRSDAGPCLQEAQSNGISELASDGDLKLLSAQPDLLRKMFSLYATLYVHLLQHQGEADKLLQLLLQLKKRVKSFVATEPKHARFLRRQALVLTDALLGTVQASLASVELQVTSALHQEAAPAAAAQLAPGPSPGMLGPMEGSTEAGTSNSQPQPEQTASPAPHQQGADNSPTQGAGDSKVEGQPTAAPVVAPEPGATPVVDARAPPGTPGLLPSSEQQLLQDRVMAILQVANSFHREVARWLQVVGASSGGNGAREELQVLRTAGEDAVLRAHHLFVRCSRQPVVGTLSRAEQLKAADELVKEHVKQQRRQSRQPVGRPHQAAPAGDSLPPVLEQGEEEQHALPRQLVIGSTRKRSRAATGEPEEGRSQPPPPRS